MRLKENVRSLNPSSIKTQIPSSHPRFLNHRTWLLPPIVPGFFDSVYLFTKISPTIERLKICKIPNEKDLTIQLEKGEKILDTYEGVELRWICLMKDVSHMTSTSWLGS